MDEDKNCVVCGTGQSQLCTGCRLVRYCSKAHQIAHWTEHKLFCKCNYRVECIDAVTGHYLVAAKDLKAGAIIFKEEPLVVSMKNSEGPAICLGCCCDLSGRQAVNCPKCKWPMCGQKQCWGEGSYHALGECSLLKAAGSRGTGNFSKWVAKEVYPSILMLRCLALRQRDPSNWEKLMEFKFCGNPNWKNEFQSNSDSDAMKLVNQWVPESVNIQETLHKLCTFFFINSYELSEDEDQFALYYAASMIDHSCVANAIKTITTDGQIIIRAAVSIIKGSKITLNFTNPPLFASTMKRQLDVEQTKFDFCRCERCKDPTELGTFASGVYCSKCPDQEGVLLSENPLDQKSNWQCNKCSDRKPASFVLGSLKKLEGEWIDLDRDSVPDCEGFVRKYGKLIHPRHFFMADVKLALCQIYCKSEESHLIHKIDDEMKKKGVVVEELLKILDAISPGLNSLRGFLLFHHLAVVVTQIYKKCLVRDLTESEVQSSFDGTNKILEELQIIYLFDPEDSLGCSLVKTATRQLQSLREICSNPGIDCQ